MDLTALLPRQHVLLHLVGRDRRAILAALTAPLAQDKAVLDMQVFLADLERREDEITTQMNATTAFPHTRSTAIARLVLTVGIADAPGLPFSPQTSVCCRLFFLIGVPFFAPTAHLPLLQRLATFAQNEQVVAKLLAAETPAQAVRCLGAYKD